MSLQASENLSLPLKPLPDNVRNAIYDGLESHGFKPETMIKENYAFSGRDGRRVTVNALVFTHDIHRTLDYTGFTIFNPARDENELLLARVLAQSAAPFHLIYRGESESFSFWFSNVRDRKAQEVEPVLAERDINYTKLSQVLDAYAADIKPQQIIDVKQGRGEFTNPRFRQTGPFQLSLWAIDVTGDLLVEHFGRVVNALYKYHDWHGSAIPKRDVTDIAIQLLGATILAHTGVLGENIRQEDPSMDLLIHAAYEKFGNYFDIELLKRWNEAVALAYQILKELRFSGFAPDMLKRLYTEAYPDLKDRKELGRYDTPLYLTRRIWDAIPVEFLPPDKRVIADMTCGWGSFLIAGYERFTRMIDMQNYSLREYIYGNDENHFTARLAALGLLISASEDTWHIYNQDAMEWKWLERRPNIIVGNPPFLGDRKTIRGKVERYQKADQFLARAIDYLEPEGYLAMLMPQSFVAAESSPTLRKQLLESCDVLELWELPLGVFPDAQANTIVIFAQKKKSSNINGSLSSHPVRLRTVQNPKENLDKFQESGIFTASGIHINQSSWNERSRKSEGSKVTHIMDYRLILSQQAWAKVRDHCVDLQKIAVVFSGLTPGTPKNGKYWNYKSSEEIRWFSGVQKTMPRAFSIDYGQYKTAKYPNDFQWPRIESKELFKGSKILLVSTPNPSWGKRVKVAIERRGYFVSNNFWPIARKPDTPSYLTDEVIAAVLDWYVCNAWIVEHLKTLWVQKRSVDTIPFPQNLTRKNCQILTDAVRAIENNQERPQKATDAIDRVLKAAYQLDDEIFERLRLIAEWDTKPQITLDKQPDPDAKWQTSGVVDSVDAQNGIITLWLSDFDELQTVPISSSMPGWLLRPDVAFRTSIPRACVRQHSLSKASWGHFYPQDYTYRGEEELFGELTDILSSTLIEPHDAEIHS
ncbi:SAM-dependent methyltransferase [candidate division KSB1 bacterium]|nr:SAM-dependent methyltransferase [candidate division KSB1 bacterium]